MEQLFIGGVLVALVIFLAKSRFSAALLFASVIVLFTFLGFIDVPDMLGYFTNEALITLLLLLHVSSVVEKTPLIPRLSRNIFQNPGLQPSLLKLTSYAMFFSSVLNNTAIVATLMGVAKNNPAKLPASKLLIPLSYAAIMGGVLTLVGTSTNLIVNSFVQKAGLPEIGFFDFAFVGVPIALVGLVYLVWILPRFLPSRGWKEDVPDEPYFLEAVITEGSILVGKSIEENGLRNMDQLYLAEVIRGNELISPVPPYEILQVNDTLVFTGAVSQIQELRQFPGLEISAGTEEILNSNLQEVVVRHTSPMIGRRIKDSYFRTKFDAVVVAVRRGDEKLSGKIGNIVVRTGDDLVLAVGKEFFRHENLRKNFTLLNTIKPQDVLTAKDGWVVVGLFLLGIILAATGVLTLFKAMVGLLFVFMGLRFLRPKHIKNNLNISLLVMIGSALGISQVITDYGLADTLSEVLLWIFGMENPWLALAGIYLTTVVTTEIVTNNAAAALMFPIALATADQLGVSPTPYIMAIAYAASASFLTPIGYQTNTMVYGAGRYKFTDFFKAGIWLSLIYSLMAIGLIPYFFPF